LRGRRRRERIPTPKKADDEARTRRAACASGAGVNAYRLRRKQMTKPVRAVPLARKAPACARTDLITRRRGERRLVPPSIKPRSRSPTQHQLSSKTRRSRKTLESQSTANSRRTEPRTTATRQSETARRPEIDSVADGARVKPSQPRETPAVRARRLFATLGSRARPGEAGRRSKVKTPRTRRELSPGRRQRYIWIQRAALRPNPRSTGRGSNPPQPRKRSRCKRAWFRHARRLAEEPWEFAGKFCRPRNYSTARFAV